MTAIAEICQYLETFAPRHLAEDWDNVGLLVGDAGSEVKKVMTCLTVTPSSANEAIENGVELIISHHPLPFRSLKRLTTDDSAGRLLLDLIKANVAIFSPHTSFDSARCGINQVLAERVDLTKIKPLNPIANEPNGLGTGRFGELAEETTLSQFAGKVKTVFALDGIQVVGQSHQVVRRIAVACGSGGSFLQDAIREGCDTLLTGETSFHHCLEAEASGVAIVLPGHFASERFALEMLAEVVKTKFSGLDVWASRQESDPITLM